MWPFTWRGKNTALTSVKTISDQMRERRPLPMGSKEFEEWSARIISGACIPGATERSQRFALADMLLHLGPTESHKEDAFFIHSLRKFAVNQVADEMRRRIRDEAKELLAKEQETAKKLEIEKRYEDQISHWPREEQDAFIHARYLEEQATVSKLKPISAATPNNTEGNSGAENGVISSAKKAESPSTTA